MKIHGTIWVEPREITLAPVGEGFLFKFIIQEPHQNEWTGYKQPGFRNDDLSIGG